MTNNEAAEEIQKAIDLIRQDGKDWLDERDIPILEMAINALTKEAWKEEHPVSPLLQKPATTAQDEKRTETHSCDCFSRSMAVDAVQKIAHIATLPDGDDAIRKSAVKYVLSNLPSAQPFHNITMDDVLIFIDRMPEDVWQEFTACLECRGWELQRRTAKWCGGEFA